MYSPIPIDDCPPTLLHLLLLPLTLRLIRIPFTIPTQPHLLPPLPHLRLDPLAALLSVPRQHVVQPRHLALPHAAEAILADLLRGLGIRPAGVVWRHIDARVRLVPMRQLRVSLRFDGP
jgi:hypothetical protein